MRVLMLMLLTVALSAAESSTDWRQAWHREFTQAWQAKSDNVVRAEAESGNAVAMWYWASRLYHAERFVEAAAWREKAAKAGLPQGLTEQAEDLAEKDIMGAVAMLEKAAATGFPGAKISLAKTLLGGEIDTQHKYITASPARAV